MDGKNKLLDKKKYGDISIVASMIGVTPDYAKMLIRRQTAKRHQEAIDALTKVIESREQLLNNK